MRRIYGGLLAAAVLLGCAASVIRDPRWLLQIVIWSCAVACVIFLGALAKGLLAHPPQAFGNRELCSGLAALTLFVGAVAYLRRQRRRRDNQDGP
jgi:hypothetical protein